MNEEEQRAAILDFEKHRQMLASISAQKQQINMQVEMAKAALEELSKTTEKTVYKVVGNVLFPKDAKEMEKELTEKKESIELRLKTVEKQEDTIVKKLKAIQSKLEEEMKASQEKPAEPETKIEKKRK